MTRRICIVTGTRAEYGLLRYLMKGVQEDAALELQVIATGMHLSPEFGLTYQAIEADGFKLARKIEMLLSSDSGCAIGKSVGLGIIGFADAYAQLEPDLIVILGDRFEILAAATAALFARIPIVHLHGGEVTEGALDESIRHAVTKLSSVHCVATEVCRRRVIQLGEQPDRVHCVGGLGVDVIKHTELLTRAALEDALGFRFMERNLLITFHPATLEDSEPVEQMKALLDALDGLDETGQIFTLPNADAGGRELIAMLQNYVDEHSNAKVFASLGQQRYLSCMAHCDGVLGNSSSGLLEAPTLEIGTINIGNRQRGRQQAASIINCRAERGDILAALQRLYSPAFQSGLCSIRNPYGEGGASARVLDLVKGLSLEGLQQKPFFDLPAIAGI